MFRSSRMVFPADSIDHTVTCNTRGTPTVGCLKVHEANKEASGVSLVKQHARPGPGVSVAVFGSCIPSLGWRNATRSEGSPVVSGQTVGRSGLFFQPNRNSRWPAADGRQKWFRRRFLGTIPPPLQHLEPNAIRTALGPVVLDTS